MSQWKGLLVVYRVKRLLEVFRKSIDTVDAPVDLVSSEGDFVVFGTCVVTVKDCLEPQWALQKSVLQQLGAHNTLLLVCNTALHFNCFAQELLMFRCSRLPDLSSEYKMQFSS